MGINSVMLSGNLTRDCEVRQTNTGTTVVSFGVAVNEKKKNQQTGEWEDVPCFVDVSMFGNYAQAVAPHLKKGSKIALSGKLRYSSWERDGQKRTKLEVIANEIELLARRENQQQQPVNPQVQFAAQQAQAATGYAQGYQQPYQQSVYDSDIPF